MRALLIYNPSAGNNEFRNELDYVIERFQEKKYKLDFIRIGEKTNIESEMIDLLPLEYNKVIIAGGDGTIHNVINVIMKNNIDIPISIFPVGTSNDYARYFNMPRDIKGMVDVALRDNYTACDIGLANDKYFINVASAGNIIDISQRTNEELKNNVGVMAYYLSAIEEITNLKAINMNIISEECKYNGKVFFVLVVNGKSVLGFNQIAPDASMSDGVFDVFIVKKVHRIELIPLIIKALNGDHVNSDSVISFQTNRLRIECDEKTGTDLDGESSLTFPIELEAISKRLKINTKYNNEDGKKVERVFSFSEARDVVENLSKAIAMGIKNPFSDLVSDRNVAKDIVEIVTDLGKHDTLNYINKETLNEDYFNTAEKTLDNGYVYLVLSSTGSAAGEIIGKVTKKEYSHVSLSFDEELSTIVSYNGGEDIYSPGLNKELIEYFYKKEDANILVYKLKATKEQKRIILNEIIKINEQGSSYNLLGLVLKYSHKENIMFCSQFVYTMLKTAGIEYFEKKSGDVKPTDFVELDYERKLEFCNKVFVKEII